MLGFVGFEDLKLRSDFFSGLETQDHSFAAQGIGLVLCGLVRIKSSALPLPDVSTILPAVFVMSLNL